jgi:hypothetical protein
MNSTDLSVSEVDAIWDSFQEAPTMSFRYLVTDAILNAVRATQPAERAAEPEGWVLVPIEPTRKMCLADWNVSLSDAHTEWGVSECVWAAMLAVAPKYDAEAQAERAPPFVEGKEQGLGACPDSRAILGVRTHEREAEASHRTVGIEDPRQHHAGRGAEIHASSAQSRARGGDVGPSEDQVGNAVGGAAREAPPERLTESSVLQMARDSGIESACISYVLDFAERIRRAAIAREAPPVAQAEPLPKPSECNWPDCACDWKVCGPDAEHHGEASCL